MLGPFLGAPVYAETLDGTDNSNYVYKGGQYTFPSGNSTALGLVWFRQGFVVFASTELTMDVCFPVNGAIDLNTGTVKLDRDMVLGSDVTLEDSGTIKGEGKAIILNGNLTYPDSGTSKTLTVDYTTTAETIIDGQGHAFTIADSNTLSVAANTQLTLKNMDFSVLGTLSMGAGSTLRLDNVRLHLDSDLTISGALQVAGQCSVSCKRDQTLTYSSSTALAIDSRSGLTLGPSVTLAYTAASTFTFTDHSSVLTLQGATFDCSKASTTLVLKAGTSIIDHHSYIKSSGSSLGVDLGATGSTDRLYVELMPGAQLDVSGGAVNYQNDS